MSCGRPIEIPQKDKFAYLFLETLSDNKNARQPARIKIGDQVVNLTRVATGGKSNSDDLFEYHLYKMPGEHEFVILRLTLGDLVGEDVDIDRGSMSIIMKGKPVFRASVKGNAGCMTPAVAASPPKAAAVKPAAVVEPTHNEVSPDMFQRYAVRGEQVPRKITQAAAAKFGCEPSTMRKGVTGFQLSEESAIWQIPCGQYADKTSAVFALVYLPDTAKDYTFLPLKMPKGLKRVLGDNALMDPKWDMKARVVTGIHTEGNGSDCGQFERYRVTDEGGFKLIEFRSKDGCDGKKMQPKDFPLVFKAPPG